MQVDLYVGSSLFTGPFSDCQARSDFRLLESSCAVQAFIIELMIA